MEEENLPLVSVDVEWLESHLTSLRHEIEAKSDADLRKAAKLAIVAGDQALDEGDLHRAALQCLAAAFLVAAAKLRVASSG